MDTEEALRRIRRITLMLRDDIATAVTSHAVLEAGNGTIPGGLIGVDTEFVATFNAMQYALTMKLALDLARIFDLSERNPREAQDKASILVLAALLGRADVKARLAKSKSTADFLAITGRFDADGSEEKVALRRVRQFRTQRLAHALFDEEPDQLPKFADLFLLLAVAREAIEHASLAVDGLNTAFDDQARCDRQNADGYYICVLDGLKRAAQSL
jgi:hypothetical protein